MKTCVVESGWLRLSTNLLLASCLRLVLIVYGLIQDHLMQVKYTDIDYIVFTDGARLVSQGRSPYLRSTYRYTPLLAWLLQPNVLLSPIFGKLLFSAFDIAAGYIVYLLVLESTKKHSSALHCAQLWLFNPVTLAVSTRGNAESLMAVLVLAVLLLVVAQRGLPRLILAGLLYGAAVHIKIYPITYVFVMYLFINGRKVEGSIVMLSWKDRIRFILPGRDVIVFGVASLIAFCGLTTVFYMKYGDTFLHETYFYHLTRRDIRHNFSPYFYLLYLLSAGTESATLYSLAMFLPQVILMVATAARYHNHLEFACFVQTFVFVTFNKVCTSQYFLWYLCLLPLVVPHLVMDLKTAGKLCTLWLLGQGLWLYPAYLLEFHCYNSFIYIWLAGMVFFTINSYILYSFIDRFRPQTIINTSENNKGQLQMHEEHDKNL